jgi:hypothetical protein
MNRLPPSLDRLVVAVAATLGLMIARDARADDVVGTTADAPSGGAAALGDAAAVPPPGRHHYELGAQAVYTMPPIRGGTNQFGFILSHVYVGGSVVSYLGGTDVDTSESALLLGGEVGYDIGTPLGDGWFTLRPQVGVGGVQITRKDPSLLSVASAVTTRAAKLGKPDVITQATSSRPAPASPAAGTSGTSGTPGTSGSTGSSSGASDTITVSNVYVQPGITALYSADLFFVGANANVLIVPGLDYGGYSTSWFAFGVQGLAGLRW